jgi:hypothetical protein
MRQPPDANERRPRAESGAHDGDHDVSTSVTAAVGDLLALSDERDWWLARLLAAERAAYRRGFADGRARACVALAELQEHYDQIAWWHEYAAKVRRIIRASTDPGARRRRIEREIAQDEQFLWVATLKQAERPGTLSPLESQVLRRIGHADPGEAAQLDAQ